MTTVSIVEQRNIVTITGQETVTVVSVGIQGPPGETGDDGVAVERFKTGQTVTPSPNGAITQFTLPEAIIPGTLKVYLGVNGGTYARVFNFTENTPTTFTFTTDLPPNALESIFVDYISAS